jgi:hypothetical protein
LERVRAAGEPQHGERAALQRDTPEGPRTHWYSWTYTPVWCDGQVGGVFAVINDETADELAAHHARALSAAADASTAADPSGGLRNLVRVLATLPDVRFAAAHLLEPEGSWTRVAHSGSVLRGPAAISVLDHAERTGRWPAPTEPRTTSPGSSSAVVRTPGRDSHVLWDSWSAETTMGDRRLALTIGFAPRVGDSRRHRSFVLDLLDQLAHSSDVPSR